MLKQGGTVKHIISLYIWYTQRDSGKKVGIDKVGQKKLKKMDTEEGRHREKRT